MAEKEKPQSQPRPLFDRIYRIATSGDEQLISELQAVETFLREFAKLPPDKRLELEIPAALYNPKFQEPFRELGDKTPLAAIRAALIEEEKKKERTEILGSPKIKRAQRPTEKIVFEANQAGVEGDSLEQIEVFVNPPKAKPPSGYISQAALCNEFHLPREKLINVLRSVERETYGSTGVCYLEAEARRILSEYQENRKVRRETLARERRLTKALQNLKKGHVSTKKDLVSSQRPLAERESYVSFSAVRRRFPDIPRRDLQMILLPVSMRRTYYMESEVIERVNEYRKIQETRRLILETLQREERLKRALAKLEKPSQKRTSGKREITQKRVRSSEKSQPPKKRQRSPQHRPTFSVPVGYEPKDLFMEQYPDIPKWKKQQILTSLALEVNGGPYGRFYQADAAHEALRDYQALQRELREEEERIRVERRPQQAERKKELDKERKKRLRKSLGDKPSADTHATVAGLMKKYGVSRELVLTATAGQDFIQWGTGKYFSIQTAGEQIKTYQEQKAKITNVKIIEGRRKAPLLYFNQTYGVHYDTLRREATHVASIEQNGVTLYDVEAFEGRLQNFRARQAAKKAAAAHKKITMPEKRDDSLITTSTLAEEYETTVYFIQIILGPLRDKIRKVGKAKQYPETEARQLLDTFKERPEINQETDEYVDDAGGVYLPVNKIQPKIGVGKGTVDQAIKEGKVAKIAVRRGMRGYTFYKLSDVQAYNVTLKQIQADVKEAARNDAQAERIRLLEEKARVLLSQGIRLDTQSLRKGGHIMFERAVRKHYTGGIVALRSNMDVADTVSKRYNWQAMEDAETVIRKLVLIYMLENNKSTIIKQDLNDLGVASAVDRLYTDQYQGLLRDLYIQPLRTSWESYPEKERIERIEEKAREILAEGGRLSTQDLRVNNSAFETAIVKYYPGGLPALRKKLGVGDTVKRKKYNFAQEADPVASITQEIRRIIAEEGDIESEDLNKRGLYGPIQRYYPGGYQQLRKDLGLPKKGRWAKRK